MPDVVIDTNVLVQSGNSQDKNFEHCGRVIAEIWASKKVICTDAGGLIEREYSDRVSNLTLGGSFLAYMLKHRLKQCDITEATQSAGVENLVTHISNARDRTFVKVAYLSEEKTLVSNDHQDYTARIRKRARKELNVIIVEASSYSCK